LCWNTSSNPTITNNKITSGTGTGSFSSAISGLTSGTTYYVRAYATNSIGTSYGNNLSFTTTSQSSNTGSITTSVSSLYNFGNVYAGNYSEAQFFTVSGTGLSNNITVSAPTGFVISLTYKTAYASSIIINHSNGIISSKKVFVRYNPASIGTNSGNLNISGASLPKTISISGTCVASYIPAGYYSTATGSGAALKTQLYNKIKVHTQRSYDNLWTDFQSTDKKPNGKVWDMYSNIPDGNSSYEFSFGTNQCGTYAKEGDCYNREHSFPKSWFNEGTPMYTDLFHLVPTDGKVNGLRSNYMLGKVSSPTTTSTNGSKLGTCSYPGYTGIVFEPIDEYKGDFARSYFYMATCYENVISSWQKNDTYGDALLNGTSFPAFEAWALNMLLEWNTNDPVSQKEINRNQAVYNIQKNRNPFIDNPEFVNLIWGSKNSHNTSKQEFDKENELDVIIYPNPTKDFINITGFTDLTNIRIINLLGTEIINFQTNNNEEKINVSNLPSGIYTISINSRNKLLLRKFIKN